MSYNPATDFLDLLRQTSGGLRTARIPGLDWFVEALMRAGLITLSVSQTAPISSQTTTAWFKPATPSWVSEGSFFLWNSVTAQYELATPVLWSALFLAVALPVNQDVGVVGPVGVLAAATTVRVMNVGAPVSLVMPLSSLKTVPVLITDWANLAGTNNITITRTGGDVFPNGLTSLTIAGDGGSFFLRPVPGGYAL